MQLLITDYSLIKYTNLHQMSCIILGFNHFYYCRLSFLNYLNTNYLYSVDFIYNFIVIK